MSAPSTLHLAVVGMGHLGRYHLEKLHNNSRAKVVIGVDPNPEACSDAASRWDLPTAATWQEMPSEVTAAVIAAPTTAHSEIALGLIDRGVSLLIEKPIASSQEQAQRICDAAEAKGVQVHVGHTERFNPAVEAALPLAQKPGYVVSERLAPFSGRSTDIDVVRDLMIHDLDIVASLVDSPLREVRAVGVPIITSATDMCSARLEFESGAVAQLAAGRASFEPKRNLRFFSRERYVSVDCHNREVKSVRRRIEAGSDWPQLEGETVHVADHDALQAQDDAFVQSVLDGTAPRVSGRDGLRALQMAEAILKAMTMPLVG